GRAGRDRAARDRHVGRVALHLPTVRTSEVRAGRRGTRSFAVLARGLRRRRLRLVRGCDERPRDVRRLPLPARHGEGLGPRRAGRPARARLQLRLQPVLRLRPPLGVPARPARESARGAREGRRAGAFGDPGRRARICFNRRVTALYRKYRPQTFAEVVGQEAVVRTLSNAIEQDKVRQAYLFAGPRGTGKTSLARILAKSINC